MNGPRGYYAKWNKSDRERQLQYDFTYMWSKKQNKWTNIRQKQTYRYREQVDGSQREEGGWKKK